MKITDPKNQKLERLQEHSKVKDKKINVTSENPSIRKTAHYVDHLELSEKENRLEQLKPQIHADLKRREADHKKQIFQEMIQKADSGDQKAQVWVAQKYTHDNNLDMAIKYYNMAGGHQNLGVQKALTQIYATHSKELSLDSLAEGIAFSLEDQHEEIVTKLLGELEARGKAGDPGAQQVFDAFIQIIMSEPTKS